MFYPGCAILDCGGCFGGNAPLIDVNVQSVWKKLNKDYEYLPVKKGKSSSTEVNQVVDFIDFFL